MSTDRKMFGNSPKRCNRFQFFLIPLIAVRIGRAFGNDHLVTRVDIQELVVDAKAKEVGLRMWWYPPLVTVTRD